VGTQGELHFDSRKMGLNGFGTDAQSLGNCPAGESIAEQAEYLALAHRKQFGGRTRRVETVLDGSDREQLSHSRTKVSISAKRTCECISILADGILSQHDSTGARAESRKDLWRVFPPEPCDARDAGS
jgi:hypothetical protein